ncbi:MAG: hypothetical protein HS109_08855 [Burkholderiales bacterium]|nr:hypothetical protein [Burkholderiales bacterium]
MKARLRELTLASGLPLEQLSPRCLEVTVQAVLGPDPGDGDELFDFSVRVGVDAQDFGSGGYAWAGKTLMMQAFDPMRVSEAVSELLAEVEGQDWASVVSQLREHMRWEFDIS